MTQWFPGATGGTAEIEGGRVGVRPPSLLVKPTYLGYTSNVTPNENLSLDDLIEIALAADDTIAVTLLMLADQGAIVAATIPPGWEVEYQPQIDSARPWADDEGNRFTTAEVAAT